jgi:hypothetical protein
MRRHLAKIFAASLLLLIFNLALASSSPQDPQYPAPAIQATQTGDYLVKARVDIKYADGKKGRSTSIYLYSNRNILDVFDSFKDARIGFYFPGYDTNTTTLSGTVNLRGVNVTVQRSIDHGVATLHFCLLYASGNKQCHEFQSFVKATASLAAKSGFGSVQVLNEDVWDQLIDWLKGKGGSLLTQLADDWVSSTAIDPVAGNPNSFFAQLTKSNFNLAANGMLNNASEGSLNLFSLTPSYSDVTNNGFSVRSASLPLKYTHYFNDNNALIVDAPITYQQIQSATSYSVALGMGFTHVLLRTPSKVAWALTPSLNVGAVGSADLGAGTLLYDTALASRVVIPHGNITYGITDDVSYLVTSKIKIGDIETPYDLNNITMLNGGDITYAASKNYNIGGYINRFDVLSGMKWYVPSYNEIGFKLSKLTTHNKISYSQYTGSLSYLFGEHQYQGVEFTAGFNF